MLPLARPRQEPCYNAAFAAVTGALEFRCAMRVVWLGTGTARIKHRYSTTYENETRSLNRRLSVD